MFNHNYLGYINNHILLTFSNYTTPHRHIILIPVYTIFTFAAQFLIVYC